MTKEMLEKFIELCEDWDDSEGDESQEIFTKALTTWFELEPDYKNVMSQRFSLSTTELKKWAEGTDLPSSDTQTQMISYLMMVAKRKLFSLASS